MGKPNKGRGGQKAASSSRAAELAATSSASPLSFQNLGGFAQFASPAVTPTPGRGDGAAPSTGHLSPGLVVIIKKMSKRDAITKLKALEELNTYLEANQHEIPDVIPSWCKMYSKLTIEVDRRVRCMANQVHRMIGANAKKKLAPHLKEMAGPWMITQFDQSKDVASAARAAFETVFPLEEKRLGVMEFCQRDILDYIAEILLSKTPETLSDPRYVTKEDMEAKFARVVAACFYCLCHLMENLPDKELGKCTDAYDRLLDDPVFWKFLAYDNAFVRKAAYRLVKVLLLQRKDAISSRLDSVSPLFFSSLLAEKDRVCFGDLWDAFLLLTKEFPECWFKASPKKPILPKFYHFLRNGLNGAVSVGYPSMIVLIANMPKELRETPNFYKELFGNFWKGEAVIEKPSVFINAYAECIVYAIVSECNAGNVDTSMTRLLSDLVWDYLTEKKKGAEIAPILAKHLAVLGSVSSVQPLLPALFSELESVLMHTIMHCSTPHDNKRVEDVDSFCAKTGALLRSLYDEIAVQQQQAANTNAFYGQVVDWSKRILVAALGSALVFKEKASSFLKLANDLQEHFGSLSSSNDVQLIVQHTRQLLVPLLSDPSFNVDCIDLYAKFYVRLLNNQLSDAVARRELWIAAVEAASSISYDQRQARTLIHLMQQMKLGGPPKVEIQAEALDTLVEKYVICSSLERRDVLEQCAVASLDLHLSHRFLSESTFEKIMDAFYSSLVQGYSTERSLSVLSVLETLFSRGDNVQAMMLEYPAIAQKLAIQIFDASFVSDLLISQKASAVWESIATGIKAQECRGIIQSLFTHVKKSIVDLSFPSSPLGSVQRVQRLLSSFGSTEAEEELVLYTEQEWDRLLTPHVQHTADFMSLSIVDEFVGLVQTAPLDSDELLPVSYDAYGLSAYGRLLFFLAEYILHVGVDAFLFSSARDWIMHRLMVASVQCQHGLEVPGISRIWDHRVREGMLDAQLFVQHVEAIVDQWFSHAALPDRWSTELYEHVFGEECAGDKRLRMVGGLMRSAYVMASADAEEEETTVLDAAAARVLAGLLDKLLSRANVVVEERWLNALRPESNQIKLAAKVALLRTFKNAMDNIQVLQSELVSKLSGVASLTEFVDSQHKAWSHLVLLNASSLKIGSFAIPAQRLTHLLLNIRKWFAEEDVDDQRVRVHVQMAILFGHLGDSLQQVSAGQWDFIVQRVSEWITYSDAECLEELALVYHGLRLFEKVVEEEEISPEESARLYETVLRLFMEEKVIEPVSKPRLVYQRQLSSLLQAIPGEILLQSSDMPKLCGLLTAQTDVLQLRAYDLLKKHVSHIVQDASVRLEFTETATTEEEESRNAQIQDALFKQLLNPPDISNWHTTPFEEQPLHQILGFLLSWSLLFDHFKDITFRLKQEYTSQLKEADAVSVLLPFLSHLLGVGVNQSVSPFDLALWDVEYYDTEGFEFGTEMSYLLLVAHLYYCSLRHIPSLVRQWWVDCKNKQLKIGVESYVEKNFSGSLINTELDLLDRPDIRSLLMEGEEFTVKALRAANEVTATYRVDEQDMQIVIKLPSNYPLQQIDVEGVQKVGVSDKQWRGWIFSVAAVIVFQNGNIVDALTVFKRNLNLHFEGVEDCTICYSIISAQDRSIPSKQCRTCKNKFHASCLYKWFRSSNSASCPLCRTLF